jgi:hypothetical protein
MKEKDDATKLLEEMKANSSIYSPLSLFVLVGQIFDSINLFY